jgi:hypothetical protein
MPPTAVRPLLPPRALCAALLCAALAMLAACSPYKVAGDHLMRFSEKVIVPHELGGTDLGIGCQAVLSWTAPGIAFEQVGTDVRQIAVLLELTAGVCSEIRALDSELAFLRAMRAQQPYLAQDARIEQKRALAIAARRQYSAYRRFVAHYGAPTEGRCPAFENDFDELVYMIGMLAGVQAMINDAQTGQFISVPRDIAPAITHMVNCIDGEKWWDIPNGVRAAIWHTIPLFAPPDVNAMEIMERVAERGERDGVRLGHVIWAMASVNSGDTANAKRAIRDFSSPPADFMANPKYRMLDTVAADILLAVSDRIWTEQAGHRTPVGGLGTFPDDPPKRAAGGIDDLLPGGGE